MRVPRVSPGEPITAAAWNALAEAVERALALSAGPGLRRLGRAVAMAQGWHEPLFRGVVAETRANGKAVWGAELDVGHDPLTLAYLVQAVGRGSSFRFLAAGAALLNRPNTRGTAPVYPARPGDEVLILRRPDVEGTVHARCVLLTEEFVIDPCEDEEEGDGEGDEEGDEEGDGGPVEGGPGGTPGGTVSGGSVPGAAGA